MHILKLLIVFQKKEKGAREKYLKNQHIGEYEQPMV